MFYPDFWWFLVVLPNSCGFWSCKNGGANSPSWGCTPWKSWASGYGSSHWRPQTWQSIIFYLNLESIPGTCWTWSLNKGFWGFSHCSPNIFISKSLVHQWLVTSAMSPGTVRRLAECLHHCTRSDTLFYPNGPSWGCEKNGRNMSWLAGDLWVF